MSGDLTGVPYIDGSSGFGVWYGESDFPPDSITALAMHTKLCTAGDTIATQAWGECWRIDEPLPEAALGGRSLWVRVRLFSVDCPNIGYSVAQFGRNRDNPTQPTFGIVADLTPTPDARDE